MGSHNSAAQVFQDAQVHVLTPWQMRVASHGAASACITACGRRENSPCLTPVREAGLLFVRNPHRDNSNRWEQMQGTDENTSVRFGECQETVRYIYNFHHL